MVKIGFQFQNNMWEEITWVLDTPFFDALGANLIHMYRALLQGNQVILWGVGLTKC